MESLKSDSNQTAPWIRLANIDCGHESAFVILLDKKNNSLYAIQENAKYTLKYSFDTNSWIENTITPSLNANVPRQAIAIDHDQNKIFINYEQGSIATITLNNDNQHQLELVNDLQGIGSGDWSTGTVINNKFHIIAGDGNKHIQYDPSTQKVEVLYDFHDIYPRKVHYPEIVRIQSKILMFGGYDDRGYGVDTICESNVEGYEWYELKCKLPQPLSQFGCTSILNGQFVALFGGENDIGFQDDILLYSVCNETFKISKIKCPEPDCYHAVAINDGNKDKLITFGFIRSKWKECKMNAHSFPPQCLIQIICDYYWNEYVHLNALYGCKHHRIDVFELLDY